MAELKHVFVQNNCGTSICVTIHLNFVGYKENVVTGGGISGARGGPE